MVSFISVETGTDLVLSFAVVEPDDPTQIESLIRQRAPEFEPLLEEWERGVKVAFERYGLDEDDFVEEVHWSNSRWNGRAASAAATSPGMMAIRTVAIVIALGAGTRE